jgi:hypothetical protein
MMSLADSVKQTVLEYERRLNAGEYAAVAQYYADDPRFYWVVDSGVALVTTRYTGTMGAAKFSGDMTIVLIRTAAGWRFLAGQS